MCKGEEKVSYNERRMQLKSAGPPDPTLINIGKIVKVKKGY